MRSPPSLVLALVDCAALAHPGLPPLPMRRVLVVDPDGRLPTQAFFTTDLNMSPVCVMELFLQHWSL